MPNLDINLFKTTAVSAFSRQTMPAGTNRDTFNTYLGQIGQCIGTALDQWRQRTVLQGAIIAGPIVSGGRLVGPLLDPLIRGANPPGNWAAYNTAIAAGVHNQFHQMLALAIVPGLAWYPQFAAWPGPVAPPQPARPEKLLTLCMPGLALVDPGAVKQAIVQKFGHNKPPCAEGVAQAVADGLNKALMPWLSTNLLHNVMGGGPVPTFCPPMVPVGPVVGGLAQQVGPGNIR
ncbi:hypothetical protein [Rubrivivax rivuli]|uniref:Uncharacterized protein n=1 Tax=Rubrivivax rivuli TaxID=1862385 RepID=A0A437RRK1_9BURK|nr:hypothetical protein [Rubrivivax rivuli]RVU49398.1 hypothetical protein EOE66_02150 [Rubrivivax rivuli]